MEATSKTRIERSTAATASQRPSGLTAIDVTADPYAAAAGAVVLAVLTEWEEFKWLDFDKVGEAMAERRVVDARNLLDRNGLVRRGFRYDGIGR